MKPVVLGKVCTLQPALLTVNWKGSAPMEKGQTFESLWIQPSSSSTNNKTPTSHCFLFARC